MTNEHAIDVIKHLKKYYNDKNEWEDGYIGFDNEDNEAIDLAIKALKQQSCEDCVSREAVLDVINFEDEWLFDAKSYNADTKIAFSAIKSKISELPSVTPQRPKGKWIEIEIDAGEFIYKCTKCGMRVINPYKYCPICGAEMGGTDEVSD